MPIKSGHHIPALDGLRGLAILLVLLWHSIFQVHIQKYPKLDWILRLGSLSWSGVDLFFVLSGFLIGGILLDAVESPNYFRTFYARRAYRILPLYFLMLVVWWGIGEAGFRGWTPALFRERMNWWTFITFTQNIWMATKAKFTGGGTAPTWSLAVEEQFYLTLPLVVRSVSRRRLFYLMSAVVIGAPLLRVFLMRYFTNGIFASYVLMPCRADALGLGVLAAMLVRNQKATGFLKRHRTIVFAFASVLLAVLVSIVCASYQVMTTRSARFYGIEYSILAFFYTSILLIALTAEDAFVRTVFCNRPLRELGLIAYGTYLFHLSLISIFELAIKPTWTWQIIGTQLIAVTTSIGLAAISWVVFERPLVRRGHEYKY